VEVRDVGVIRGHGRRTALGSPSTSSARSSRLQHWRRVPRNEGVARGAFAMCSCALFSVSSVTSVTSVSSESQTSCRRRDRMPVGFVAHVTLQPSRSSAVQGGDVSPVHERTAGKPAVASKRDPDDIRMASSACVVSRWMPRSALPDRESARGRRIAVLTVQPPTNHPSAGVRTSRRPWPGPR